MAAFAADADSGASSGNQGIGPARAAVREIARQTGFSRNTVRRYLRDEQAAGTAGVSREQRSSTRSRTTCWSASPRRGRTGFRQRCPASRATGSRIRRRHQSAQGVSGPQSVPKSNRLVRFETAPGKQMQADFTVIRRGREPLLALVATMGYSRASFVRFTAREDATTLCDCLREALVLLRRYAGTRAVRHNAKSVVIERDAFGEGEHRWNRSCWRWRKPLASRPRCVARIARRPEGKVERFNRYLKESFVVPLAATLKSAGLKLDVDTANAHIGRWLTEVANRRRHATTGERPAVRLAAEQVALLPLPAQTPALAVPANRRVLPRESLQHPLAVYDALLEVAA